MIHRPLWLYRGGVATQPTGNELEELIDELAGRPMSEQEIGAALARLDAALDVR
jgi:hypothetical protein